MYIFKKKFFKCLLFFICSYQFNQHLMDSLCQEIQELDALSIVGHETSDGESDMDEHVSILCLSF